MFKYKKIFLIGAGQIGNRHLQALKNVSLPLDISVIDPSKESLLNAEKRYQEIKVPKEIHQVNFLAEIPSQNKIDLAVVATASNVRAKTIKDLLKNNRVRFMILEKLLFDKKKDYPVIEKLLAKNKVKAWVNCPLRLRPIYQKIKKDFSDKKVNFRISGSNLGLSTITIHFLDFLIDLVGNESFTIDTSLLDQKTYPSKRKGFLEINGILQVKFANGTKAELTSYHSGNTSPLIEIFNREARYIFTDQELNFEAWVSQDKNSWIWEKVPFYTPLISETTTWAAEDILKNSSCDLPSYKNSSQVHLSFLEPLRKFLNKNSKKKYDYYPFT